MKNHTGLLLTLLLATFALTLVTARQGRIRPKKLSVEVVNSTSIVIRWTPPEDSACDVKKYIIRIKESGDKRSEAVKVDGGKKGVIIGNLNEGSTYSVRLKAVDCQGKGAGTRWAKVTMLPGSAQGTNNVVRTDESKAPGKPASLRTRTLASSVIMHWRPPLDNVVIRGYIVGYGEGVPDVNWLYVDGNLRTYTLINLKPGTQYVISLRAFNNKGKGPVMYDLVYTREEAGPQLEPFAAPVDLQARILSPTSAWLQWTDPDLGKHQQITDDRFYNVNYRSLPEGKYQSINVKALHVVLNSLSPYTRYEFKVKTMTSSRASPFSNSVANRTFEVEPSSPPQSVYAILKNDTVYLSWKQPAMPNGRIIDYLVLYTTNPMLPNRNWNVKAVDGPRTVIYPISGNKTYYFKVQARNNIGVSPMSTTVVIRTPGAKDQEKSPITSVHQDLRETVHPPPNASRQVQIPDDLPHPKAGEGDGDKGKTKRNLDRGGGGGGALGYLPDDQPLQWEFATFVQHKVSAVVTWRKTCKDAREEDSKQFVFQYYAVDDPAIKINITTSSSLVILDGLKPNKRYGYRVKVQREDGKGGGWSVEGFVDTDMVTKI